MDDSEKQLDNLSNRVLSKNPVDAKKKSYTETLFEEIKKSLSMYLWKCLKIKFFEN